MVSHCRASRLANRAWLQMEGVTFSGSALPVRTWSPRRSCSRQWHPRMPVQTNLELLGEGSADGRHDVSPLVAAIGASLRKGRLGARPLALGQSRESFLAESEFYRSLACALARRTRSPS